MLESIDAPYVKKFTALAVTKNFVGSPHIDTQNIGPFYGMALGDFRNIEAQDHVPRRGGALCVESGPMEVTYVDTKGKMAKVDGRFPHWVEP